MEIKTIRKNKLNSSEGSAFVECRLPVLAMTADVIQVTYEEYKIGNGWICVKALR
jgi:arabidopsis histidine kinase 2/3/4 (cytokinin receptor)